MESKSQAQNQPKPTVRITDGPHKDRLAKIVRRNGNTTQIQFASDFHYAWVRTAILAEAEIA